MRSVLCVLLLLVCKLHSLPFYEANEIDKHHLAIQQCMAGMRGCQGSCTIDQAKLMMKTIYLTRPNTYVEIGVLQGSSIVPIAVAMRDLNHGKIYAVDGWSKKIAVKNLSKDDYRYKFWRKHNFNTHYQFFKRLVSGFGIENICTVIKSDSLSAASKVPDDIDVIHFDGSWDEQLAVKEVEAYLPKIKIGGYVFFSDYNLCIEGLLPRRKAFQRLLENCYIVDYCDNYSFFVLKKFK